MNTTVYLQFASLLYLTFLLSVFYIKKRVNNIETRFYGIFLITNLVGLIIDILLALVSVKMNINSILYAILAKSYLVYFITWVALLCSYMYIISKKKRIYMRISNIKN